ncbi:MAG TPA: hypothetical protein VNE42_09085 [Acidimicrobiales bacterium]|nr:hypothetical protein [Acidimicrobiales bacterium]
MEATSSVQLTSKDRSDERRTRIQALATAAPFALVVATVAFNLVTLHAETTPIAYLNDGTVHSEMVRFATAQIRAGHFPLTGWFPLLGEGSPQFIHYQSLGAMLTGGLGVLIGPNVAYAWVLYLTLATWPISIYLAIRLLGFDRLSASFGAMLSPLVVSTLGIGYEQQSYLSIGYGLWSQLFAMWTLPLAWGWTWRATENRRAILPATVFITLTIAFHYFTGYLAIFGMLIAFLTSASPLRTRVRGFLELAIFVGLTSAWVVVPLLQLRPFASINEFLIHGPDVNSYGARRIISWLVTGQLFDAHRRPVLSAFVFLGLSITLLRARHDRRSRNLLALFVLTLLAFFGRTTFGVLFRLLPGSEDLFLRRFVMGVQLAGIIAAGIGMAPVIRAIGTAARTMHARLHIFDGSRDKIWLFERVCAFALVVSVLIPCWSQIIAIDQAEATNIAFQHRADQTSGAIIAPIISDIATHGGRVYAGLPVQTGEVGGWGSSLTVGKVPVFKYLTHFNLDVVGYTLRTASLMTDPEAYFDENISSDFPLFGVRWLIYPLDKRPPKGATLVMRRGAYVLWELHTSGVIQLVDTVGAISADRTNIGARTAAFIRSTLAGRARYLTVGFNRAPAPMPTLPDRSTPAGLPGEITGSHLALDRGFASASVNASRASVVVLKASFDPGWQAEVDGRPAKTEMIAPAYVGVRVSRGHHLVSFTYKSDAHVGSLLLVLLGSATLCIARFLCAKRSREPRSSRRRCLNTDSTGP